MPGVSVILRQLRTLMATQKAEGQTDGHLLERFASQHDEVAFAALLERHGPMVLGVCRRILHDEHRAEDAFQATFLVLVRKAGTIRKQQSIASWLHGVALRLTRKAKIEAARAAQLDARSYSQTAPEIQTEASWHETQEILDDELQRLPENYRLPLVLCYLEGLTRDEAAAQLGWTANKLRGFLERGRDRLRSRLTRRGVTLSSAASGMLLADTILVATVPPLLAVATNHAAASLAAGTALTACGISGPVVAMTQGGLKMVASKKITVMLALMLFTAVIGSGVGIFAQRIEPVEARQLNEPPVLAVAQELLKKNEEPKVERVDRFGDPQPTDAIARLEQAPTKTVSVKEVISTSGVVVDEHNKPIAGATVYLRELALLRDRAKMQDPDYTDIMAQTTTDLTGKFAFKEIAAEPMGLSPSNFYQNPWNLVVTAPGRAVAWHLFKSRSEIGLTLMMRPEAELGGQLLDDKGKPAVGVRAQVDTIEEPYDPDPRKRVIRDNRLELHGTRVPLFAVTNAEGRFVLKGLPKDYHVGLLATDSRFARKYLRSSTLSKAAIDRLNAPASVPATSKLLAHGFTASLEAGGTIRGRVIYADTGEPAAGARVTYGIVVAITGKDGKYVFKEVDSRKWSVTVSPPNGAAYFTAGANVSLAPGNLLHEQNFALERGLLVSGELRDKTTGETLRVARLGISYQKDEGEGDLGPATVRRNPNGSIPTLSRTYTEADGTFGIVVPLGKGRLFTFESPLGRGLVGGAGVTAVAIDVKPGQNLTGQHLYFTLPKQEIRGKVIDGDGKPMADAVFHGASAQGRSGVDGSFVLKGLSTDQKSHFLVLSEPRGLGANLTIDPVKPENVEVKLVPTKTLKGRVVDENGKPIGNGRVTLLFNFTISENAGTSRIAQGPILTDSSGAFSFANLVPGGSYSVRAEVLGRAGVQKRVRVEDGVNPDVPPLILLPSNLAISGIVVDGQGRPVEGAQVVVMPRDKELHDLIENHHSLNTEKNGKFYFRGLPRGEYRLIATLWKATDKLDREGRPIHTNEGTLELRVAAGEEDMRMVLKLRAK